MAKIKNYRLLRLSAIPFINESSERSLLNILNDFQNSRHNLQQCILVLHEIVKDDWWWKVIFLSFNEKIESISISWTCCPRNVVRIWFGSEFYFQCNGLFHGEFSILTAQTNSVKLISAPFSLSLWRLLQGKSRDLLVRRLIKQAQSISIHAWKTYVIWDCSWDSGQSWWCFGVAKVILFWFVFEMVDLKIVEIKQVQWPDLFYLFQSTCTFWQIIMYLSRW